jgi:hypothetical protein
MNDVRERCQLIRPDAAGVMISGYRSVVPFDNPAKNIAASFANHVSRQTRIGNLFLVNKC